MKSTFLYALFVAILANQPSARGPAQEDKAAIKQGEQQSAVVEPSKVQPPEEEARRETLAKAVAKRRESIHKD